jgi:potassium efflux system protein
MRCKNALGALLLGWCAAAFPQNPLPLLPLPLAEPMEPAKPEAAAPLMDIAAERAQVQAHVEEARKQLAEARRALSAADASIDQEDRQALEQRISLLETRVQIGRRHLDLLAQAQSVREERRQVQGEVDTWSGFPDPPPYPLDLAESLARKLRSQQNAIGIDALRLASFTQGIPLVTEQLDRTEQAFRRTLEALESTSAAPATQSARRDHALNELSVAVVGEGLAFVRAGEQSVKERLALERLRQEFTRRQFDLVLKDLRLTPEETHSRQAALDQALKAAERLLTGTERAEASAADLLAELRKRAEPQAGRPLPALERNLAETRLDTLRTTLDHINLEIGYLQNLRNFWGRRLALYQNWDVVQAKAELADIEASVKPIAEGIAAFRLAQAGTGALGLDPRFEAPELASAKAALAEAQRARDAQLASALRAAQQLQDFLEEWQWAIQARLGDQGAAEQTRAWGDVFLDHVQRFWSFEVLSVEDTLTVNGEAIIEKRPVTVGKFIEAALILALGLLAASGLARVLGRALPSLSARRWQRRLLIQKLLRVGMIILVVVLALVTVKIPLTVFAFLGGAIALGIGFGAKNLINNFISGFILLGEGTIRPGDRVEIEGNLGIVQRIGDRSTLVRRFDGVDMMIPNSHFLESSVTNLTLSDRRLRISIGVGVAYGAPTRQVEALLLEIARANPLVTKTPAPVAVFEDFGDSALAFRLYAWVDLAAQEDYRAVTTELRHTIAERFAEAGFAMAFPQLDVHLDANGLERFGSGFTGL